MNLTPVVEDDLIKPRDDELLTLATTERRLSSSSFVVTISGADREPLETSHRPRLVAAYDDEDDRASIDLWTKGDTELLDGQAPRSDDLLSNSLERVGPTFLERVIELSRAVIYVYIYLLLCIYIKFL